MNQSENIKIVCIEFVIKFDRDKIGNPNYEFHNRFHSIQQQTHHFLFRKERFGFD